MARLICLRLLAQLTRFAASRAFCTAGMSRPIRSPMIAMTTSSSTSVKPRDGADFPVGREQRKTMKYLLNEIDSPPQESASHFTPRMGGDKQISARAAVSQSFHRGFASENCSYYQRYPQAARREENPLAPFAPLMRGHHPPTWWEEWKL